MMNQILHGDCLSLLPTLPDKSVDLTLNRQFICIEKDREFFDRSVERLHHDTTQAAIALPMENAA